MTAQGDARRALIGEKACRRAQEIADAAPPLSPRMRAVLSALMRVPARDEQDTDAA